MPRHERGLALVTVLLLLALLLVLAMVLADRVVRTTRDTASNGAREQALQAAGAALEWVRQPLAANYRASQGWADYLTAAGRGDQYPETPAFHLPVGGITVELYLRDNPDGDDDPHRDNDLKLLVLARARTQFGVEAVVEGLCGLAGGDDGAYTQGGSTAGRTGLVAVDGPGELSNAPVAGFELTE